MTRLLLQNATVFDGESAPASGDVVIAGDKIVDVGAGLDADQALDLSGCTLAPAFFDCHVHVNRYLVDLAPRLEHPFSYQFYAAARNLGAALDCGITTVRDAGGADLGTKLAQQDGLIEGARVLLSIAAIGPTGGHTDPWKVSGDRAYHWMPHPGRPLALCDGPDNMRSNARTLMRAGADILKVCSTGGVMSVRDSPHRQQFSDEELEILVLEAARQGKYVMAHAQGHSGIEQAVEAGVRSIEHGTFLSDRAIEMMVEKKVWLVPTMVASLSVVDAVDAGLSLPAATVEKAREGVAAHADSLERAYRAGVKIAMGTDAGVSPHGQNLRELGEMTAAGMDPLDVLRSSTAVSADLLEMGDTYGRLTLGRQADLIAYEGLPTDFKNLKERIRLVIQDGKVVRRNGIPD